MPKQKYLKEEMKVGGVWARRCGEGAGDMQKDQAGEQLRLPRSAGCNQQG